MIYNYFVVTNFFWMFVEGCYLHTAIVMTYSTDKLRKWVFLFIGWCKCCVLYHYCIIWLSVLKKQYNQDGQKRNPREVILLSFKSHPI